MSTTRAGARHSILGVLFLIILVAAADARAEAAGGTALAGSVRDALGNLLGGVEVLLVALPSTDFEPAAVVRSDRTGKFEVARLVPGRYRIAALKDGYRTWIGQVDTGQQGSVDVVLQPEEAVATSPSPPQRADWALRVPRRGMLHEVGAGAEDPLAALPPATPGALDPVAASSLEVEQFFAVGPGAPSGGAEEADLEASETRLKVAAGLGGRGHLRASGGFERLGSVDGAEGLGTARASREGGAVGVDLGYDLGAEARLAATAHFRQTDHELDEGDAGSLQQRQRTWGYDAGWSRQVDADGRVSVALAVRDASLVGGWAQVETTPGDLQPASETEDLIHRTAGAEGSYVGVLGGNHDLQVSVRAEMLESPLASPPHPSGLEQDATASWFLEAHALDAWSVGAPVSLLYGVGVRQALAGPDTALVVPRVGGAARIGATFARALISYHTVSGANAQGPAHESTAFVPRDTLGYEAEIEVAVAPDVRIRGGSSYAPILFESLGYLPGGGTGDHPLFATDGNAAVHEHRLALVEERGGSHTYVEIADGRATGTVAPFMAFEEPLPLASGGELRYRNGRAGVVFAERGTDVRVEYRRVEAASGAEASTGPDAREESVEMRVRQDVSGLQMPGDWRLLLGLRVGNVRSGELAEGGPEAEESVNALNRRISAGVSVLF